MKVRVLLFARARDMLGADQVEVDLPAGATVQTLQNALTERWPHAASFLRRCAVAIHDEYVSSDRIIPDNASVAVIPPVSGGFESGGHVDQEPSAILHASPPYSSQNADPVKFDSTTDPIPDRLPANCDPKF